jgi:predicted Fe-S protein YdhL (DUF1289 family)
MNPAILRLTRRVPSVLDMTKDLPSPCQSICDMNEVSGMCTGCLRTLPEIAAWGSLNDEEKRQIWAQIERRAQNS